MKRVISVLLIVLLLVLAGCSKGTEPDNGGNDPASSVGDSPEDGETSDTNDEVDEDLDEDEDDNISVHDDNSIELPIYTIGNDMTCIPSTALVDKNKDVDAELIINEVTANFAKKIEIEEIYEGKDNVAVYFKKDSAPLKDVSKAMEEAMLDCIAYSLMDNLDYCEKVYFRAGDGNYESSNIVLGYDEAYVTR